MKKEVSLWKKKKRHFWNDKTELVIAGVSIAAIIAVIIGSKNHKALEETWASLRKLVEKTPECIPAPQQLPVTDAAPEKDIVEINIMTAGRIPHDVAEHLRNLPEGWKASTEKIATAAEQGYELLPGQTWVKTYRTGGLAA